MWHVYGGQKSAYRILVVRLEGRRTPGKPERKKENDIKTDL
jgi:hypothetical protein